MEGSGENFDLIAIGLSDHATILLSGALGGAKLFEVRDAAGVESVLETYDLKPGTTIFIGSEIKEMSHLEIGQALSSGFPGTQVAFVTFDRQLFNFEDLKKNGFTSVFLLPIDAKVFKEFCEEAVRAKKGGIGRKFRAVKLVDVGAGEHLDFDLYTFLPRNNRHVSLTASGEISEKKMSMLKSGSVNNLLVDVGEIDKFYEFSAERLLALGQTGNDAVSETEKLEKIGTAVRELFRSVLSVNTDKVNFESGRDFIDQSKKVVSMMVSKKTGLDIGAQLKQAVGEDGDAYSHAQSVSTIACLLSMATGVGSPEDVAIAALFHDLGSTGATPQSFFDDSNLTEDERKAYQQHPKVSLNLLREKRITVTEHIANIIERHHERDDGRGFPAAVPSHRIPDEASLLCYADAVEHLTRPTGIAGQAPLTVAQAHELISEKMSIKPDVLRKISAFIKSI